MGLLWESYLLTEYTHGLTLSDLLRDGATGHDRRAAIVQQVIEMLDRLGRYRITHGDMKHTNILVTDAGPVLIDLDGLNTHRCLWLYRVRKAKDLARLKRDCDAQNRE
jgi:tRNA A-37 threonylcarbamoyl transferase component Bud32